MYAACFKFRKFPETPKFYYGNGRVYKDIVQTKIFYRIVPICLRPIRMVSLSLSIVHTYIYIYLYIYMELICDLNRSGTLISTIDDIRM